MSRSHHRKKRHGKCFCGRWLVTYHERSASIRGQHLAECPVLHPVHEINEQFLRFRERRSLPLTVED